MPVYGIDLLAVPGSSRGYHSKSSLARGPAIINEQGEQVFKGIKSGDVFTLTTAYSPIAPLPSWQLLEMQWYLQRVVGMSGLAKPYLNGNGDVEN